MAVTTLTQSIASGTLTGMLWYNEGPSLVMMGHYASLNTGTACIEPGMMNVSEVWVSHVDANGIYLSANANGTYAVLFSGLTSGLTGWFEIRGY